MKLFLFILFSCIPNISFAQGRIEYEYDEVGNRICQSCIMPVLNKAMAKPKKLGDDKFADGQEPLRISLYPNPTSDIVHLYINSRESDV